MLFNSFPFIVLVFIAFCFYYINYFAKYQVQILIAASLFFYAYHRPILLLLLLTTASINIITSYFVAYTSSQNKKLYATVGVIANLSILLFFKYSPLVGRSCFEPGSSIGDFLLTIPLPIGISFYTFQGISLMIDVYKEKYFDSKKVIFHSFKKHIFQILFFTSFFPQLTSGPIVKAHDFLPQIKTKYFKDINWESCLKKLILGYFLKMVISDNLKEFTMWIEYPHFQGQTTISLLFMLFGYSCQFFADFAGYSSIAIGLAELFGYKLNMNFNFPYISTSFREFWKRWHISLSSFLMEYLYFPLGGNRKGKARTYLNLIITMLLGGLWHGAAWSYLAWGGLHGSLLAIERFFAGKLNMNPNNFLVRNLQRLIVFFFVSLAWLLFKLPDFSHVVAFFKTLVSNMSFSFDSKTSLLIMIYSSPVIFYHLLYLHKEKAYVKTIKKYEYAVYSLLLFCIFTGSGSPGSFIYFQF